MSVRSVFVIGRITGEYQTASDWTNDIRRARVFGRKQDAQAAIEYDRKLAARRGRDESKGAQVFELVCDWQKTKENE